MCSTKARGWEHTHTHSSVGGRSVSSLHTRSWWHVRGLCVSFSLTHTSIATPSPSTTHPLSSHTQVRKQAEDAVKQLSNRPEVIPQLVQQLQAAGDAQVRQLSAVLLRKWIGRHWDKLPPQVCMRTLCCIEGAW